MASWAQIAQSATGPTGNCNDAFYNQPRSQFGGVTPVGDLFGHEGAFFSEAYCCALLSQDCVDDASANEYVELYTAA